jgi:CRISPR-associated protein Cmr1
MKMTELRYRMSFTTPAFLGNAEQAGQWRTPPIKAQLRQWWRVVYAAEHRQRLNLNAMRHAEGYLFGVAADSDGDSRKSRLRLRLTDWKAGTLKSWDGLEQAAVRHPEVERTGYRVGPHAYLGFGPLDGRAGTKLSGKVNAAIAARDEAELQLAFPEDAEADRLRTALSLMNLYGTLGGRSRNGWGSFELAQAQGVSTLPSTLDAQLVQPWREALLQDWAGSIGCDDKGPLIWQTDVMPDWRAVMRRLAEVKIALRTLKSFEFPNARSDGRVHPRHWLSYPVTNHEVHEWRGLRLPNTLRFKVRSGTGGKLRGVIFHMPSKPPAAFGSKADTLSRVWQQVHQHLDGLKGDRNIPLDRIAA